LTLINVQITPTPQRQARHRIEEARFFLAELRATGREDRRFPFHLHALVSATRSVSLVLQKDLRGEFGSAFDAWWSNEVSQLTSATLPFEALRELRNMLEKEGSRFPIAHYRTELAYGPIEAINYLWSGHESPPSPFLEHIAAAVLVQHGLLLTSVVYRESDPRVAQLRLVPPQPDGRLDPRAMVELFAINSDVAKQLQTSAITPRFVGFQLQPGEGPNFSAEQLFSAFEEYLDLLAACVSRSDMQFPFSGNLRLSASIAT
jgi:hypothetical protein